MGFTDEDLLVKVGTGLRERDELGRHRDVFSDKDFFLGLTLGCGSGVSGGGGDLCSMTRTSLSG